MLTSLTRNWWVAALRGTVAIIFGAAAFIRPDATLELLVILFGAYALSDGIVVVMLGVLGAKHQHPRWPMVILGLVGVATGLLTFAQPAAVALSLVYVIGAWAIVTGILEVVAAVHLRKVIRNEWLVAASGGLSILFGLLVMAMPGTGALTIVLLFGVYAISAGTSQVALGFRLRGLGRHFSAGRVLA